MQRRARGVVLIIEDDIGIASTLADMFGIAGYYVRHVTDSAGAHTEIQAQVPDLIVLDIMLPRSSGSALLREFRNHQHIAAVPVIILTALDDDDLRVSMFELGADYYLTKPYRTREMLAIADMLVRRRRTLAAADTSTETDVDVFVVHMQQWVRFHLHRPSITIRDAAVSLGLSDSGMQRRMRHHFGTSFRRWLTEQRLERAHRLIESGATRMSDVAARCGFINSAHFSVAFKKRYGLPPKRLSGSYAPATRA